MIAPALSDPLSSCSACSFDYGPLPASVQREVRMQAASIHEMLAKTSCHVVQIGLRLEVVRRAVGRDQFQPWLRSEFQWSQSVASNYMRAARAFADVDRLDRFQPSALFVLARRKVPAAARLEAVRLSRSGELITKSRAKAIVEAFTPCSRPRPARLGRLLSRLLAAAAKLSADELEIIGHESLRLAGERRSSAVSAEHI